MSVGTVFRPLSGWLPFSLFAIALLESSPALAMALVLLGALATAVLCLEPTPGRHHRSLERPARFHFLIRHQWVVLLLLCPLFLFPGGWRTLALLALPVLWGVRWVLAGSPIPATPLDMLILLMLAMVLVSLWATYNLAQSLPKIAGLLWGIAIYYAATDAMIDQRSWERGLAALLLVGLAVAFLGLIGTPWPAKLSALVPLTERFPLLLRGVPGAESGLNPNEVGGALTWVLPPGLALARGSWQTRRRAIAGLSAGIVLFMLAVVVLSQSRSALLGLAVAFVGTLLLLGGRRARRALVGAIAIVLLVGMWLGPSRVNEHLLDRSGFSNLAQGASSVGRTELWSRALYAIGDFPFTGMGMNTFRIVMPVVYPLSWVSPDRDIAHAHNEFLQVALDLGLPGLTAFVSLYVVAAVLLVRSYRRAGNAFLRSAVVGLGAGLVGHLTYGFTDAVALGSKPSFLFWLLLALVVASHRQAGLGSTRAM